jgi:hypothetical protein
VKQYHQSRGNGAHNIQHLRRVRRDFARLNVRRHTLMQGDGHHPVLGSSANGIDRLPAFASEKHVASFAAHWHRFFGVMAALILPSN